MSTPAIERGTVKWFDAGRGYGFIRSHAGRELFMHITQVRDNIVPVKDDKVEFVPDLGKNGRPCASRIKIIEGNKNSMTGHRNAMVR